MENIYAFGSQESLRQDIYLTQGVNETYSAFVCRVSGFRLRCGEPDRLLRLVSSESSNSSPSSFKNNLDYVSAIPEYNSLSGKGNVAERYYFHMRTETIKNPSLRNNNLALQAITKRPEMQARNSETGDMKNKTIYRAILSFIGQCFMPRRNERK